MFIQTDDPYSNGASRERMIESHNEDVSDEKNATLRQQIEATLTKGQRLYVKSFQGRFDAFIETVDKHGTSRKGTYGKTPDEALRNLANILGIVPELEAQVDASGILRDIKIGDALAKIGVAIIVGMFIWTLILFDDSDFKDARYAAVRTK